MVDIVECYRQRKFDEDLKIIEEKYTDIAGLATMLRSDVKRGITAADFESRDQHFGSNEKKASERTPFCTLFLGALNDFMLKVLIVSAVISIIVSMIFEADHRSTAWIEGTAILLAVFVVSFVTAWNDYKKEEQFEALNKLNEDTNRVTAIRNGEETFVQFNDIKVGDVLQIKAGMAIPCDGVVIEASGVQTTEAAMTGESDEMKKDSLEVCQERRSEIEEEDKVLPKGVEPNHNHHDLPSILMLSGTQVVVGEGTFLVIVVGKNSCVGKIFESLQQEVEATPLQMKLEQIATDIGKLGVISATITVLVLFLRFFIETGISDAGFQWGDKIGGYVSDWFGYLITGITIIVVAVPEGLPLAVIISLAYSVRKMYAEKNFVKKLASCEIMGGANNICSDKTGTLTKNEMTVTDVYQGTATHKITTEAPQYNYNDYFKCKKVSDLFSQSLATNTQGNLNEASATELAMLKMLNKFGTDFEMVREQHKGHKLVRFPFTSKRKKMSTILDNITDQENGHTKRIHSKGAAEIVLALCEFWLDEDGNKQPLDETKKEEYMNTIETYARGALRTICLAYKDLKIGEGGPNHDQEAADGFNKEVEVNGGLVCIGILGIKDVIRPEVPGAVTTCQSAGIRVRMVTGDNKITAMAIAKECKIFNKSDSEYACMEGPEFYDVVGGLMCVTCNKPSPQECKCDPKKISEKVKNLEEFKKIWPELNVLARSRPDDKYLLVSALRECGEVVAVTGDGTNDAPAMKKADVGFAMGIAGTDVAKAAADIVLLDDNFASIVVAVKWGRNIYDNIRRFLQF